MKMVRCTAIAFSTLAAAFGSSLFAEEPTFPFVKQNQIVLDRGPEGTFDSTHAKYPCILRVGDEWWMWYNGRADDAFTGAVGLAKSRDGLHWKKANGGRPVFDHGPPGTFDSTKADHPAVLFFDGQFHMWYTAGDTKSHYKIGYAVSRDGEHWTRENGAKPVFGPGAKGKFDDRGRSPSGGRPRRFGTSAHVVQRRRSPEILPRGSRHE